MLKLEMCVKSIVKYIRALSWFGIGFIAVNFKVSHELQNPILVDFVDFCDLIGVDKSVLNDCSLSGYTKVLKDKVQKILQVYIVLE